MSQLETASAENLSRILCTKNSTQILPDAADKLERGIFGECRGDVGKLEFYTLNGTSAVLF